jgi:hypothetical protein
MKQTLITTLALGLGFLSLLMAPSAHAQRYLVNGHPATAGEERVLGSYGFDAGAWRIDGWGISRDVAHADFVPEPRLPQCRYVLGVPPTATKYRLFRAKRRVPSESSSTSHLSGG